MNQPNEEYILVTLDYFKKSIFVDIDGVSLIENEINSLSTALWNYSWEENIEIVPYHSRYEPIRWEFLIEKKEQFATRLTQIVERIAKVLPSIKIETYHENQFYE